MAGKKARGKRAKTRAKFRHKGPKATVNKLLQEIPEGKNVQVEIDSSMHKGLTFKRFQGLTGKIIGRQGSAYLVRFMHGKKPKTIIVGAAHLKQIGS